MCNSNLTKNRVLLLLSLFQRCLKEAQPFALEKNTASGWLWEIAEVKIKTFFFMYLKVWHKCLIGEYSHVPQQIEKNGEKVS